MASRASRDETCIQPKIPLSSIRARCRCPYTQCTSQSLAHHEVSRRLAFLPPDARGATRCRCADQYSVRPETSKKTRDLQDMGSIKNDKAIGAVANHLVCVNASSVCKQNAVHVDRADSKPRRQQKRRANVCIRSCRHTCAGSKCEVDVQEC